MVETKTAYIKPHLLMSLSFDDLLEDYRKYGHYFAALHRDTEVEPIDLLKHKLVFVIGEPGQGKTRLLEELYSLSEVQKVKCDLKMRGREETIESLISSQINGWDFNKEAIVLLDGLDEVAQTDILYAIRRIKEFIRNTPRCSIIIASRLRYFSEYESYFNEPNHAQYVMVEPLKLNQAKQFLTSLGISSGRIQTVLKSLRFRRDGPLIIQNPRYLEFLAAYLNNNPSAVENINRAMIFNSFVENALKVEDEKHATSLRQIKRLFLERLALSMEIARVSSISERDFTIFLDSAKSDAKLALLVQTTIDDLYVHSLLKHDDENVSFDNVEMQEYLAANAILGMKDRWHVIFDLVVDPNLRELYPSWVNTMSFMVDEMPELLPQLLKLREGAATAAIDEGWYRLLTGSTSLKLTNETKQDIFNQVVSYYFDHSLYLPEDIAFNLANYIQPSQINELITTMESSTREVKVIPHLINTIRILGHAVALEKLPNAKVNGLREYFVREALKTDETQIQREIIDALGSFSDETILSELLPLASTSDTQVLDALQNTASDINRNNKDSIAIFAEGMKRKESHYARYGLLTVDKPEGIGIVLQVLAQDGDVLFQLIEHNTLFRSAENNFLATLERHWRNDWLSLAKQIVYSSFNPESGYYAVRSDFIKGLISLIGKKDGLYFKELIDKNDTSDRIFVDDLADAIAKMMNEDDIEFLAERINNTQNLYRKGRLFSILRVLPSSGNPQAEIIERRARLILPDLYKERDAAIEEYEKYGRVSPQLESLKSYIERARLHNSLQDVGEAIRMIVNDDIHDSLIRQISEEDLQFLWGKVKENVLDRFDPADAQIKIVKQDAGGMTYNLSWPLDWFTTGVEYGFRTHRKEMASYRPKLIYLIPFAAHDTLNVIFGIVGEMTPQEQSLFIDMYADLETDRARFMINNLFEVAEKYNVYGAAPILDKVIDITDAAIWHREKALELSQFFSPNKSRLLQIFRKYIDDDEAKQLAFKANALLVTNHNNQSALRWLIKYVQNHAFEYIEPTESHFVNLKEEEIHDGKIITALKTVKDPKYVDLYLELWQTGAKLMAKGITWENYAYYLWKAVDQYFLNLIVNGDYKPLSLLEKCLSEHKDKIVAGRYISHLNSIKRNYLDAVGKPEVFADAINKHNELTTKQYIPINSDAKLFEIIYSAIDEDWRNWITQEGRTFKLEKQEQKYIYMELQNILLRKGLSSEGIQLMREAQAVDGTSTDYVIYYNFYGPILIELKRSLHGELHAKNLKSQKSYKSMKKYMREFRAKRGIFFVYDDSKMSDEEWADFAAHVTSVYEEIPGVSAIAVRIPSTPTN